MAYCTQADLVYAKDEAILKQIAGTETGGVLSVDSSIVSAAISDADAEIDYHLARRYTVPFTTVPAVVKKWSKVLALAALYQRANKDNEAANKEADKVREQLKVINAGTAVVPGATAIASVYVVSPFTDPVFDEDILEDQDAKDDD